MKKIILMSACAHFALFAEAQIAITSASLTYTQNFNSLDTSGTNLTTMPSGWDFYEWGGSSANTVYRASTGTGITGDTYSYGAAGSADRALGALSSSGVPNVSYGVRFVNLTGAYVNAVTLSFKAEQWRRSGSGNKDSVRFYYTTASGKMASDTAFSSWIGVPALLITSITTASPASAVNGNDTARVIAVSLAISLPAGDTLSLRWHDCNVTGNDDGLAIDSLTAVFAIGPPFSAYKPVIMLLDPAPNATNVPAASGCSITFDKNIRQGASGNIYIKDRIARSTQIIAAASANVTVSGKVATIGSLGLQAGKTYHITFDSTVFDTAGFLSAGLYDTTRWVFSTFAEDVRQAAWTNPNPWSFRAVNPAANGALTLYCCLPHTIKLFITVYDLEGRGVFRREYWATPGDNRIFLNTALPAGTYTVRLDDGSQWASLKVRME